MEKGFYLNLYEKMLLIRLFEEKVFKLATEGKIFGSVHLYLGEEAIATGICSNLNEDDYITSTHRGHGHLIAKGGNLNLMMAELLGKKTGYCKGKGGSMHITDFSIGVLGANGIVGGGIPIAVGAGFSIKLRRSNQVCVCFFGDGAINQGSFHESINLAAVWSLPVIFVCENNQYAVSTRVDNSCKETDLTKRAIGYGIPGVNVDGNNVLEVYQVAAEFIKKARGGEGPSLLICNTWRMKGHWFSDPDNYRNLNECKEWQIKDPIVQYRDFLMSNKITNDDEFKRIENKIKKMINEAVIYAEISDFPDPEDSLRDLFVEKEVI